MQEEKKGESSAVPNTSKSIDPKKPKIVKVVSAPPDNTPRRPIAVMVIGLVVIGVMAFIFIPRQLSNTQTESAAAATDGVYNVIERVGEPQWRESCATTMSNGVVIVQRSDGEAQACINREIVVTVDDFSAEWRFNVSSGTAYFLVGQNAQHYHAAVDAESAEIVLSVVERDGVLVTELNRLPVPLAEDRPNHLQIVRRDNDIIFSFNGNELLTRPDTLYAGESTDLWLGVGGAAASEGAATITYQSITLVER